MKRIYHMITTIAIICSGTGSVIAQFSLYANPKEMVDLDGWPFSGFQMSERQIMWPSGTLGIRLSDALGNEVLFEREFNPPQKGYFFEINTFGAIFNDVFLPPSYKEPELIRSNSYLFWNMRVAYSLIPQTLQGQGRSHFVEMGCDLGLRYNGLKHFFVESGIKLLPLGMTYQDLGIIQIGGNRSANPYLNTFYLGASPFASAGIYLNKRNQKLISLSFVAGRQSIWNYGQWISTDTYWMTDEEREKFNSDRDILFNNKAIDKKMFPLGGLHFGFNINFYFRSRMH